MAYYTDKELLRASQIAYYGVDRTVINDILGWIIDENEKRNVDIEPTFTLSEIYQHSAAFRNSIYENIRKVAGFAEDTDVSLLTKEMALDKIERETGNKTIKEKVGEMYEVISDITEGDMKDWKVTSFCYNNDMGIPGSAGKLVDGEWLLNESFSSGGDGFCAMVLETDENNAIVAYRGSDEMAGEQLLLDWFAADFGLAIDGFDTTQQLTAFDYMNEYVLGLGYENLALTGHSLGGNLAMHATISMYEQTDADALPTIQTVGYDSPGFSNNYISRHSEAIANAPYMIHYKWSVVGALLEQFEMTLSSTADVESIYGIDIEKIEHTINRHDMAFLVLQNDHITWGPSNLMMSVAADLTQYINEYPEENRSKVINYIIELIDVLVNVVDLTATGEYTKEEIFEAFDVIINHALGSFGDDLSLLGSAAIEILGHLLWAEITDIDDLLASAFVDTTYNLQTMCIEKDQHVIVDDFGVNILLFPLDVSPEDVHVHPLGENDMVAFRGTQMAEEPFQDLVLADLLLANNTQTLQQESARTYITAINEQYDYSNYVVAGHSLGGNLATHAFLTAPDDMNIVNAYSLDGPGFSDEYLNAAESVLQEKGDRICIYIKKKKPIFIGFFSIITANFR